MNGTLLSFLPSPLCTSCGMLLRPRLIRINPQIRQTCAVTNRSVADPQERLETMRKYVAMLESARVVYWAYCCAATAVVLVLIVLLIHGGQEWW